VESRTVELRTTALQMVEKQDAVNLRQCTDLIREDSSNQIPERQTETPKLCRIVKKSSMPLL